MKTIILLSAFCLLLIVSLNDAAPVDKSNVAVARKFQPRSSGSSTTYPGSSTTPKSGSSTTSKPASGSTQKPGSVTTKVTTKPSLTTTKGAASTVSVNVLLLVVASVLSSKYAF
jgi:hypothetical protein